MVRIQAQKVSQRELDNLERLLDIALGSLDGDQYLEFINMKDYSDKSKLEQVRRQWWTQKSRLTHQSNGNSATLRADLQPNGRYEVELDFEFSEIIYRQFLSQCQTSVPNMYAELTKNKRKHKEAL